MLFFVEKLCSFLLIKFLTSTKSNKIFRHDLVSKNDGCKCCRKKLSKNVVMICRKKLSKNDGDICQILSCHIVRLLKI